MNATDLHDSKIPTRYRITLRQSLFLMMVFLALVGVLTLVVSANNFSQIANASRRAALKEVLREQANNVLLDLRRSSLDLGYSLQKENHFSVALARRDKARLRELMDDQFSQYYTTAGILKLEKLYIYDADYHLVEHSSRGLSTETEQHSICENLLRNAQSRPHDQRLRAVSGLCMFQGRSYFGAYLALGLAPKGYLLVVTDPAFNMANLRKNIAEPLRILQANGEPVYSQNDWPGDAEMPNYLLVKYQHPFDLPVVGASQYALYTGKTAFELQAAHRMSKFNSNVDRAMYLSAFGAVTAYALAAVFLFYVLARGLQPLRKLQQATEHFKSGNYEKVTITTYPEISQVTEAYNAMVDRVSLLIRELEDTRREAEHSNKMKSRFLANMSHEIRTPLGVLLGYADLLWDQQLTESQRLEYVRAIQSSGQHLRQIVNDVLDISKIEAGELQMEKIPLNLGEMLSALQPMFEKLAKDKGLEFRIEAVTELPAVIFSDPTRLRQILINVINNAIKFTKHGSVTLTASCRVAEQRMLFKISDTGIGIKDSELGRIFNAYQQAGTSTARQYGGTGLGLNLSRQLARMLGGDITVTSVFGRGSVFSVTVATGALEHVEFHHWPGTIAGKTADGATPADDIKFSGRVLIAEDTPPQRDLMKLIMSRMGVKTEFAENGKIAVQKACQDTFDLVFMDMQMPVMDGVEAVRMLREQKYAGPIIALTANTLDSDRKRGLEVGCDGFLSKPLDKNELIKVLSMYLRTISAE